MRTKKDNNKLHLIFNEDEILVFFEWLCNINQRNDENLFEDVSEQRLLFDVEAELEKVIPELFEKDYIDFLLKARKRIVSN